MRKKAKSMQRNESKQITQSQEDKQSLNVLVRLLNQVTKTLNTGNIELISFACFLLGTFLQKKFPNKNSKGIAEKIKEEKYVESISLSVSNEDLEMIKRRDAISEAFFMLPPAAVDKDEQLRVRWYYTKLGFTLYINLAVKNYNQLIEDKGIQTNAQTIEAMQKKIFASVQLQLNQQKQRKQLDAECEEYQRYLAYQVIGIRKNKKGNLENEDIILKGAKIIIKNPNLDSEVRLAVDKYNAVLEMRETLHFNKLITTQLQQFKTKFIQHEKMLNQRRDNKITLFIKTVSIILAAVLTGGLALIPAVFFAKRVKGRNFTQKIAPFVASISTLPSNNSVQTDTKEQKHSSDDQKEREVTSSVENKSTVLRVKSLSSVEPSVSILTANNTITNENEENGGDSIPERSTPSEGIRLHGEKDQSSLFKEKSPIVEQKAEIINVYQTKWKAFEIGNDQPYKIYQAWPLITCSAYLFTYEKPDGKKMAILYHALSGIPHELDQIIGRIKQDGVQDLKNVKLMVASSDNANDPYTHIQSGIKKVTELRNEEFLKNNFPKENCTVINNGFSKYCVDTRGNHGLQIPKAKVNEELSSSTSLQKQKR
jgi:hypothetical protein